MKFSRRNTLLRRASILLWLSTAAYCPPADCRPLQESADGRLPSPQAQRSQEKPPARPPELQGFVAEVEAAPPEVASDAFIKLASSALVVDPT